ncbi:hypothetical protein LTR56_026613 [Elasticomyces elasticus]|nr:hypothetical protein LTR56_026613 [Elasticomyces elasticus]KAK4901089.1 hypothetical protein LTR49_027313 [Elasticomyces elasticus]
MTAPGLICSIDSITFVEPIVQHAPSQKVAAKQCQYLAVKDFKMLMLLKGFHGYSYGPLWVPPLVGPGTLANLLLAYTTQSQTQRTAYIVAALSIFSILPITFLYMEPGINGASKWKVQTLLGDEGFSMKETTWWFPSAFRHGSTLASRQWAEQTDMKDLILFWRRVNNWRWVIANAAAAFLASPPKATLEEDNSTMVTPINESHRSNGSSEPGLLWQHPSPEDTQMWEFMQRVNQRYKKEFKTYDELFQWSIENVEQVWEEIWEYCGVRASQPWKTVVTDNKTMFPRPTWYDGALLNFAENLLYPTQAVQEDAPAVIAATETTRETVSWKELRQRVKQCQSGMLAMKLQAGDRVAGYVANHTNALVAMLAATSLGAIWTAVSPDTGVTAVLDRMVQIEPVLLFTDNAVMYNGKTHPVLPKVKEIMASLPSLKSTIVFETVSSMGTDVEGSETDKVTPYSKFVSMNSSPPEALHFEQLPPDHPVYILYSSGTTGAPKCIVHGAIGTLIQHKKEHILQSDIRPGDRLFYFTTCTWMMWHWLMSGLASGATLILYDGSPFQYLANGASVKDDLAMPKLIDELQIAQFGTSAKYLSVLEQKSVMPKEQSLPMKSLKAIYSTGSPLAPSTFEYVYKAFGPNINLGSITGGTDIISLFGAPCPLHPVYVGEIQVLGLGMAVQAWDYTGKDVSSSGEPGDLVCVKPFPCQPVQFWGPTGEKKYKSSYFEQFEGVWHHGDFVRFNPQTGGLIMLGRSDGILKPSGVRFGSAEIYNILLKHFPDQIEDALCIGRRRETDADETVVLFLKMKDDSLYSDDLVDGIKSVIRKELSARHVPGIIDKCPEIPVTTNGKKVEGAVKQILCGMNVKTSASVANAGCLEWYREWAASHQ